jgi:hypothetical protein
MAIGFRTNAAGAGIGNTRIIEGEWPEVDAPAGSVALVNHVTYMTREIVPFIRKLEQAGRRRVLITVNSVPGPSIQRFLYQLVHGEAEEVVPGHVELINVIWELGILPDIRVLPQPTMPFTPAPSRAAAIAGAIARFPGEQWGWWDLGSDLEQRLRLILEPRFDELFTAGPDGFTPSYIPPGRSPRPRTGANSRREPRLIVLSRTIFRHSWVAFGLPGRAFASHGRGLADECRRRGDR